MKYYSEEIVKRMMNDSICGLSEDKLINYSSIEIPDKHGPIIDIDQIPWQYDPHFDTLHVFISQVVGMKPILEVNDG